MYLFMFFIIKRQKPVAFRKFLIDNCTIKSFCRYNTELVTDKNKILYRFHADKKKILHSISVV
jgi:hypothetical protein